MIKAIATADLHYTPKFAAEFWKSAHAFRDAIIDEKPDLITISGDIFHHSIHNSDTAGFTDLLDYVQDLLDYAPIFVVSGTPTHDVPGSLLVFTELRAAHEFTILQPGSLFRGTTPNGDEYIVAGLPEPNKSWLLGNNDFTGAEATAAAIKALSNYFSIVGALRKKTPDIPFIFLFHGEVKGATLDNWRVLPPGGIAVGIRDLESIGADYIACGHIHEPQKLGDSHIYYTGSFYPVSWGEKTQKRVQLVNIRTVSEIDKKSGDVLSSRLETSVRDINLPHPPRIKIEVSAEDADTSIGLHREGDELYDEVNGLQLWVEISGVAAELAEIREDKILKNLLECGALDGSRVTTRVIKTETTRAAEIINQKSIYDKLVIYAKNSDLEIPDETRERLIPLEGFLEASGFTRKPRELRLDLLELRGSIGIHKGLGLEEIAIDFLAEGGGLVGLVGENGSGKSTIMDNCNPYADPIGKGSKHQDNFYLRDSRSVTYWTDLSSGDRYKAEKIIDGSSKTGSAEYFLFTDNGETWVPISKEITGRKKGYEAEVLKIFGTPEMFKRSAYISQKGASIPSSVKEKKELFNELLGNDYLEVGAEIADTEVKKYEDEIQNTAGIISGLRYGLGDNLELKDELSEASNSMAAESIAKDKAAENLSAAELNVKKLTEEVAEYEKKTSEIKSLERVVSDYAGQGDNLEREIDSHEDLLSRLPETEEALSHNNALLNEINLLEDGDRESMIENAKRLAEYHAAKSAAEDDRTLYRRKIRDNESLRTEAEGTIIILKTSVDNMLEVIESADIPCEFCGKVSSTASDEIDKRKKNIAKNEKESAGIEQTIETYNQTLEMLMVRLKEIKDPGEVETLPTSEAAIEAIRSKTLTFSTVAEHENVIKNGLSAKAAIEAALSQIGRIKANIDERNAEIQGINETRALKPGNLGEAERVRDGFKNEGYHLEGNISRLQYEIERLEESIETNRKAVENIELSEAALSRAQVDSKGWTFIKNALGRNGIQALELDVLAPSVAKETNDLLEAAYGPRYELNFETTKEVGRGRDTRQAEDFELMITDRAETLEHLKKQPLNTLSGGQEVWILKALFDAFGSIRAKNTGLKFVTNFMDESDGALDADKKEQYLRMIEAAHVNAGRFQTIVITHDAGVQEILPATIRMEEIRDGGNE